MISHNNIDIKAYNYDLPEARIAKYPLPNRSDSKLLIYDKKISEAVFSDLVKRIPSGSRIIFNNTKVIHARLPFYKKSGARIEIFCLTPHKPVDYQQAFSTTNSCQWICLVGNLKKWKSGDLTLSLGEEKSTTTLTARKIGTTDNKQIIEFSWNGGISFGEIMDSLGTIPIPPYLNRESEAIDDNRYQTIYSQHKGSVAAPTAGLHFTDQILNNLRGKNISLHELSLHVGAGTFQPVKSGNAREHGMHSEVFSVTPALIEELATSAEKTIATGTTSMRALESLYWLGVKSMKNNTLCTKLEQWEYEILPQSYTCKEVFDELHKLVLHNGLKHYTAETAIMIVPGYQFKLTEGLITNFHQPKSTLLLLVAAFIGEAWKDVYNYALQNNFRFLSYGDSSLLWCISG